MKKIITLLLILTLATLSVSGQVKYQYDSPFGWASPEVMAQGGSFTAVASGFSSLMTNPAGFAQSSTYRYEEVIDNNGERTVEKQRRGELTLMSVNPTATVNPFQLYDALFADPETNMEDMGVIIDAVLEQSATNGLGVATQAGFGFVGHGVGLGFITTVDLLFPQEESLLALNGDLNITSALVAGYSHLFNIGPLALSVGGDIRPMWRVKLSDINFSIATGFLGVGGGEGEDEGFDPMVALGGLDMLSGFALGFDAGAILEWNGLSAGISVRDIGHTRYVYNSTSFDLDDLQGSILGGVEYEDYPYITPMTVRIGVGIHPELGRLSQLIDPKIHAEYVMTMVAEDIIAGYSHQSFWSNINIGAEVRLLSFISVRGGYSAGYLSAGLGLDLLFLEFNAALYSQETGTNAGSKQQMGATVEVAFRF